MNRAGFHFVVDGIMHSKRLFVILIFCTSLLWHHTSFSSNEPGSALGIVTVPLANVREAPGPRTKLVTQVLMADEVRLLDKQGYRYKIAIPNQDYIEGWVHQEAVLTDDQRITEYINNEGAWVVVTSPKARALILDKTGDHNVSIYAGTRLFMLGKTDKGITVQFPDRTVAIVKPADVRLHERFKEFQPEMIARTARRFHGMRYLAGGITTQGMDTRGLIYVVYRTQGIPVEEDRSLLKGKAQVIKKKKRLQPGDILIFHREGEGIYLGRGRFMHGVPKRSIRVHSLYKHRYSQSFKYGLRLFSSDVQQHKIPSQMTNAELLAAQSAVAEKPLGERISYWAGRFISTPYDPDPLGLYVRTRRIVADEKVDCLYHTFRSVELARAETPEDAIEAALSLRFVTRGTIANGLVQNYDARYQYGEDMVFGSRWGRNITEDLGKTRKIEGSRGRDKVRILPKEELSTEELQKKLKDGDIIYWVKDPAKRIVGEIVGHLSIVRLHEGAPHVIHAAGSKQKNWQGTVNGGVTKELPLAEYVQKMHFIGAFITRFED